MKQTIPLAAAVISLVLYCGCEQEPPPPPPPPTVSVATPEVRDVTEYRYFRGTTKSPNQVEIRARVQGFLKEVHFEDGQPVHAGQLLFTIEPEPFQAALDAAQAKVEQTDAALQLANANLARAETLFEKNAITKEEMETRKAEVAVAKAQRLADVANVEKAKIDLSYTEIKSPIDGKADRRLVDPGNLVGGLEATLLTKVVSLDPIEVKFDVNEKMVINYLRNTAENGAKYDRDNPMPAELAIAGDTGFPHQGHVDFLASEVERSTGTAELRAVFPNEQRLLYPGLSADVRLPLAERKDALLVYEQALGTDLAGKYLLVVGKDNKVEHRKVMLGSLEGKLRVIESGIESGEKYIVEGLQRARPGLPVKAETYQPPAAAKHADQETPPAKEPAPAKSKQLKPEQAPEKKSSDAESPAEPVAPDTPPEKKSPADSDSR